MVLLKANAHELTAFAELARADGADVRFMLPMYDRNGQSILTCRDTMERVEAELRAIARQLWAAGRVDGARRMLGEANVLADRLARGILRPLPDDEPPPIPLRLAGPEGRRQRRKPQHPPG
jgi:molybdenum cofactor biosynthesis enzyme MoaA